MQTILPLDCIDLIIKYSFEGVILGLSKKISYIILYYMKFKNNVFPSYLKPFISTGKITNKTIMYTKTIIDEFNDLEQLNNYHILIVDLKIFYKVPVKVNNNCLYFSYNVYIENNIISNIEIINLPLLKLDGDKLCYKEVSFIE